MLTFLLGLCLLALLLGHPTLSAGRNGQELEERRGLVAALGLTDLCLFTEARYTRHLSQADLHSAFQDHPHAMEHFPSGSLVRPPMHLLEKGSTRRDAEAQRSGMTNDILKIEHTTDNGQNAEESRETLQPDMRNRTSAHGITLD